MKAVCSHILQEQRPVGARIGCLELEREALGQLNDLSSGLYQASMSQPDHRALTGRDLPGVADPAKLR
jgi:hypothetical protein